MSDTIYIDNPNGMVPHVPVEGDARWIKHVSCEGARFHVLSWDGKGARCSEPDCIINKHREAAKGDKV